MATTPLITFKAGLCSAAGKRVTPSPGTGYLYLYTEDDLIHFCWRPRSAASTDPELDLITIPGDATFQPLVKEAGAEDVRSPTNGRIFVLKFSSSGERHYFWMQSKTQHKSGDANWFSQRDQRLGQIVDALLSGEEVDVQREVEEVRQLHRDGDGDGGDGEEDLMDLDRTDTGGAGADATGGDAREEGEANREGGADGGRAPQDPSSVVQNFLNSLNPPASQPQQPQSQDTSALVQNFLNSIGGSSQQRSSVTENPYTTLPELLTTATTIPYINSLPTAKINALCTHLPPDLFLLDQESSLTTSSTNPSPEAHQAALEALSDEQKRSILKRVLHSPQLQQSLASLTVALRDGGLPMIGEALQLRVENGGKVKGGTVPLGSGEAVEGFVEGVRRTVEEEKEKEKEAK